MSPSLDCAESREFASELKFAVAPEIAEGIRRWARERLEADPNGSGQSGDTYLTTSLYFDTAGFDVYHRRGSFGRSKYRARRYCDGPVVYLERKLKTRSLVAKRRSVVDAGDLGRIAGADAVADWPGYWFHRRLLARGLHPVCQVSYLRTARVAAGAGGPIRLTLDRDLRALAVAGPSYGPREQALPIAANISILELKYRYAMPLVFKRLVAEFGLNPAPVSKYRMAMEALGLAPGWTGVSACA
jgi:hypothetical protein